MGGFSSASVLICVAVEEGVLEANSIHVIASDSEAIHSFFAL